LRRFIVFIASVLVSALFLWLALRDVPLQEVVDRIRQANVLWLAVSLATITIGLWTRAIRWRGLLDNRIPQLQAFYIIGITFLINQLPLRAGEVARSLLARRGGVPVITAATSIVVERLLDTLLVVILLSAALSRLPAAPELASQSAALFGVAAVFGFIVLLALARYPNFARKLLAWVETIIPVLKRLPLARLLNNVIDGLHPLTTWRPFVHAIGWTLISWTLSLVSFVSLHQALAIAEVDVLLSAVLGLTLASFSVAIPVSVAAIGPFEGAVRVGGEAVKMAPALAVSLGFLAHGMSILGYAIWGTVGLAGMGMSLGDVIRRDAPQTDTPAEVR
jgi:uncharacterized membrane protein YbhN (UPF0104 family)